MNGPGSQPGDEDWSCLPLPAEIETWHAPVTPEPGTPGTGEVLTLLRAMAAAMNGNPMPAQPLVFSLHTLSADAHNLLAQMMGEGEVSAQVAPTCGRYAHTGTIVRIQESRYTGIWRVIVDDANGQRLDDHIEIGALPAEIFDEALHSGVTHGMVPDVSEIAIAAVDGLMNAPSIASEIAAAQAATLETIAQQGQTQSGNSHVINFSLLPVTPADIAWLEAMLGEGTVAIFSTGYGKCTVTATGWRHVWRVRYFDGANRVLLDTLDITRIPEVVMAAPEDLASSLEHLREMVGWLERGSVNDV
jgi:hydrogenase-1 operon protein HyaF